MIRGSLFWTFFSNSDYGSLLKNCILLCIRIFKIHYTSNVIIITTSGNPTSTTSIAGTSASIASDTPIFTTVDNSTSHASDGWLMQHSTIGVRLRYSLINAVLKQTALYIRCYGLFASNVTEHSLFALKTNLDILYPISWRITNSCGLYLAPRRTGQRALLIH